MKTKAIYEMQTPAKALSYLLLISYFWEALWILVKWIIDMRKARFWLCFVKNFFFLNLDLGLITFFFHTQHSNWFTTHSYWEIEMTTFSNVKHAESQLQVA